MASRSSLLTRPPIPRLYGHVASSMVPRAAAWRALSPRSDPTPQASEGERWSRPIPALSRETSAHRTGRSRLVLPQPVVGRLLIGRIPQVEPQHLTLAQTVKAPGPVLTLSPSRLSKR